MNYIDIVVRPKFLKAVESLENEEKLHKDAEVALKCLKSMWSEKVTANELIYMMAHHKYINGRYPTSDHLWGEYIVTLGYYIQACCKILKWKRYKRKPEHAKFYRSLRKIMKNKAFKYERIYKNKD